MNRGNNWKLNGRALPKVVSQALDIPKVRMGVIRQKAWWIKVNPSLKKRVPREVLERWVSFKMHDAIRHEITKLSLSDLLKLYRSLIKHNSKKED